MRAAHGRLGRRAEDWGGRGDRPLGRFLGVASRKPPFYKKGHNVLHKLAAICHGFGGGGGRLLLLGGLGGGVVFGQGELPFRHGV